MKTSRRHISYTIEMNRAPRGHSGRDAERAPERGNEAADVERAEAAADLERGDRRVIDDDPAVGVAAELGHRLAQRLPVEGRLAALPRQAAEDLGGVDALHGHVPGREEGVVTGGDRLQRGLVGLLPTG